MVTELGHFALILAFLVACVQAVVPMVGAQKRWPGWMAVAEPAATAQFLLTALSFAALTHAFITSDFSLRVVVQNSHSAKPMLYKISGVWGNHEGSMLLWVLILSLFGALAAWFGAICRRRCAPGCWGCRRWWGWRFSPLSSSPRTRFCAWRCRPLTGRI
ncbi:Cytochrome c heme lyase subunit CcmF [Salipiger abyssi]|uniref:Cytochrome c heme lyase subunit CcmF n=1 Tax=Salipiger abyssi TaxID=1250539 RepID=A0A1P8UY78_9RHOB|nr:Cytochrome c heme lyase subunit CcmF [Salipiger abyssi]